MIKGVELLPPHSHAENQPAPGPATLETHGLIERTPGQARSIRLLIPRDELPDLI
jgi:hypothetical protein